MKNSKRLASWVLILALLVSVLGLSAVAYGSTSPTKQDSPAPGRSSWGEIITTNLSTMKDDGIDGSKMKPGSPAFGNYTVHSIWDEKVYADLPTLKDDGIDGSNMKPGSPAFGTSGVKVEVESDNHEDDPLVPKNKTGNEQARIATFKLEKDEDKVEVTFYGSDEDAMDQIYVSLVNLSSGKIISWCPGLKESDVATFSIDDPSYTDYYAVYVSTDRAPGKANIDIRTLKSSTLVEITATNLSTMKDDGIDGSKMKPGSPAFGNYTIGSMWDEGETDLPTLKDDGIDGSKMKPGSPAFGTSGVKVEVESDNHEDDPLVPKNKTGNEQARIATFKLQEGQDRVKVTFYSSENEDDMNQINVSLVNYSFGKVISWCPGLKVGGAVTFNIDNPSYTDYYAVYISTDQTPARAGMSIKTQLGIKTK